MKNSIFPLLSVAILLAGCAKAENEEVVPDPINEKETFMVTLRASVDSSTRISADAEGNYAWQQGDVIGVLTDYGFTLSNPTQSSGTTVDFAVTLDQDNKLGDYAFYPVADVFEYRFSDIEFSLSPEYKYVKNATNMPMLGTISSTGASFKSIGAVLKVSVSNVPEDACYLRFSAGEENISGRVFITDGPTGKEIKVDNFDPECWSNQNYIDFHFWESDANDDPVSLAETNMVFYLPLPVGTYHSFTFDFRGFDESGMGYSIISKSAQMGGSGLQVKRNDIIVVPTLTLPAAAPAEPNIHDYITFSDETLRYFPELASDHPVIRIPRKEFDMSFEWYRFSYSDDIPSVELDGGNGAYGAHFVDDDNPNASWEDTWLFVGWNSSRGMCIYPRSMSNWLRSGKMVFSTNETYQNGYPTFEVPVEEYYVPTLKKNGIPVHNNESLMMYPGEAPAVITVEIPKWMTVESHDWTIYDQDGIASFSDETDDSDEYVTRYSRTVSIDPTLPYGSCRVVFNSYLSYEHMTSVGIQQMGYGVDCGINVFPFHIYDQNDNNLTNSYLYLNRGDRLTLEPRFYGISANQIEDVMWYDDSGWYEVPGTDEWEYDPERSILNLSYNSAAPYKAEITVKDNAEGEGHVSCWVKLVGEEDYNWDVSLSIYLKNSSATVSHAPSVPKYTATKNRHLSKYPHSF